MRIATFNLENLELPVAPRLAVLRPALVRLDADIVCLQEVNADHVAGSKERQLAALDEVLAGTRYATYHRAHTTRGGAGAADVHNLVTLSRQPITGVRQVRHEHAPPAMMRLVTAEPPAAGPVEATFDRPMLVTRHMIGARELTVVNVHFRAPIASPVAGQKAAPFVWRSVAGWAEGYALSALKRSGQALELRLLLDAMFSADPEAMIVVAGDFNAEDHETALRIAVGAPEDTGNAELAGRALVVLDRGIDPDRRFTVLHHGRPMMLDHILASEAAYASVRSIEVHNETLADEAIGVATGLEAAGSWHAPVVASFAFAGSPSPD